MDDDDNKIGDHPKKGSVFDDLERLRIGQDFTELGEVEHIITHVPVRKPNRHEFIRTHNDESYRLTSTLFIDKEDFSAAYLVPPEMREYLMETGDFKPIQLLTTINRRGDISLWPLAIEDPTGRTNHWADTARSAAAEAQDKWLRVVPDMSSGFYRIYAAQGDLPPPTWPELSFTQILKMAFDGRIIEGPDHPIIRKLRGLT